MTDTTSLMKLSVEPVTFPTDTEGEEAERLQTLMKESLMKICAFFAEHPDFCLGCEVVFDGTGLEPPLSPTLGLLGWFFGGLA
jgi:hypothetical protein